MSETGFLDIFVLPDNDNPVVRLQVRSSAPCWVALTPEQAYGAGAKLIECAMAIALGRARPEVEQRLLITATPAGDEPKVRRRRDRRA